MSIPTELSLTCSLLISDQPKCAIDLLCCIIPLHFLEFEVISVMTRKIQSHAWIKSLLKKESFDFLHQIIANNLLA